MSIKIEVHEFRESGEDSLTGKGGEVFIVTFADGTVTEAPISIKSLTQILRMKLGKKPKAEARHQPAQAVPMAVAAGTGPAKA